MILVFDIGNTRLKWATADNTSLSCTGVIAYAQLCDDSFIKVLDEQFTKTDSIESVWISNVGSQATYQQLNGWLEKRFNVPINVVTVDENACGISNAYADLSSLGVDRWVAAIGARSIEAAGDLVILDAGTALTIDWLSLDSVFEGGVILPGLELMHDALVGRTSGIRSEPANIDQIIGKTTIECVNSGLAYGLVGAVERVIKEMQKTIKRPLTLVLTGGAADAIIRKTDLLFKHSPHLVLLGLVKIAGEDVK